MPSLVIPDLAQVTLYWQLNGVDYANNVIYLNVGGGLTPSTAVSLANQCADLIEAAANSGSPTFRSGLAQEVTLQRIGVRSIDVANQAEHFNDNGSVMTGGSTSGTLPAGVALVTTWRTALAGKSYRGRSYWPGIAEGANTTNGNPTAAVQGATQRFSDELIDDFDALGVPLVVASRKLLSYEPVISASVDARWDTQRRRHIPGV